MALNYTGVLKQLGEARQHCVKAIKAMEEASVADGVDRSASVAGVKRDLGSYERQIDAFTKKQEALQASETAKLAVISEPEPVKTKSNK